MKLRFLGLRMVQAARLANYLIIAAYLDQLVHINFYMGYYKAMFLIWEPPISLDWSTEDHLTVLNT